MKLAAPCAEFEHFASWQITPLRSIVGSARLQKSEVGTVKARLSCVVRAGPTGGRHQEVFVVGLGVEEAFDEIEAHAAERTSAPGIAPSCASCSFELLGQEVYGSWLAAEWVVRGSSARSGVPNSLRRGHRLLGRRRWDDLLQRTTEHVSDAPWQLVPQDRAVWRDLEPQFIARATRTTPQAIKRACRQEEVESTNLRIRL